MVRVLVCPDCRKVADRTGHLDLYSTPRALLFGCKHSIEEVRASVDEQVQERASPPKKRREVHGMKVLKHSKIVFKNGRFQLKGDVLPLERRIPEELMKM